MKIAILAHYLHPIKEPFGGGLEMITHLLCKSLMQRGHSVHLYARENSDDIFDVHFLKSPKIIGKGHNGRDEHQLNNLDFAKWEIYTYSEAMNVIAKSDYDIVHNHSVHFIPIVMGNLLSSIMITTIHTPPFMPFSFGALSIRAHNRQTFIMVSKSLKKTWEDIIPEAEVVYNGIDIENWDFVEDPSGDYFFWYGRICPAKGTHLAIQAVIKSNQKLIFAGPKSNLEYYNTEVAPLLKNPNIQYLGHQLQDVLNEYVGNAKATLFTSLWEEPYGLVIAESLACGTPVIAFDKGAAREILNKETGIVLSQNSADELVKAIRSVGKFSRFKCRKRAETFCSHISMVNGYLEIYNRLLEQ